MKVIGLATFLIFLLHDERTTASSLDPRGKNVCSGSFTYNTYHTVAKQKVQYHSYRACCSKALWICFKRCTRYWTSLVTYYVNQLRVNQGTTYFCCTGYVRRGDACPQPVCRPACQNGFCWLPNRCFCRPGFTGSFCQSAVCRPACQNGFCQSPNRCVCRPGFTGSLCENAIEECEVPNQC